MKKMFSPRYMPTLSTALVLAALYIGGSVAYPNFASASVLVNLLGDNAFLAVAAIGATFVILSGGIDLSVGAMVAFSSTLVAALVERSGVAPLLAMTITLVVGAGSGAVMGSLISYFRLPAFIVTLAGMFFARGMAFVIEPQSLAIKHPFYTTTVTESLALPLGADLSLPFVALCAIILFVIAYGVIHYTRFGRGIYAVGGDEESARLMGLPIARTRILVYTVSGFCSAAGVLHSMYTQSGDPATAVGFELDAIAAVVIGGTLLSGGVGYIFGTAMGVLILGIIQTLITFQGTLNTWWTRIAVGMLVLLFLLLQRAVSTFSRGAKAVGSH
jgi:ribose/xylose/arabinose/galactoside ABC-type transport system permease subunit